MDKRKQAKKLLLAELQKEKGRFVTQRIIDRLRLFHSPLFEESFLPNLVEEINRELDGKSRRVAPDLAGRNQKETEQEAIGSITSSSPLGRRP